MMVTNRNRLELLAQLGVPLGRTGYAARAVVFLVIAGFLVTAAYQSDPSEARGLRGALLALQAQSFGWALFGFVALGLAAFGAFEFAQAKDRRIRLRKGSGVVASAKTRVA